MSEPMHTYDILARTIANEGIDTCFALLGDANMHLATRLSESGCALILVRHEHAAVAAAMAFARKRGTTAFATVTCGPGVTQLTTALPAAVRARLPLVVIAGEAPLGKAWYNQQIEQAPFVTATGAAYHALHWPAAFPRAVRDAFVQAATERRPVVLGIPFDLQEQRWSGDTALPAPARELIVRARPMPPHPQDVDDAVTLIDRATRIVVVAGLGAVEADAGPACAALADHVDALLATTLPARGLFHEHRFDLGVAGGFSTDTARAAFAETDLVIAVGCSLSHHNADGGKLWPKARVLQVDVDPQRLSQGRIAANAHLRGDARLGVEALGERVSPRPATWRTDALAHRIATAPPDGATFDHEIVHPPHAHDPRAVTAALHDALPRDWQLVNSSGHCSWFTAQMPGRPNTRFLTIREFGAIGNGIAFALGVAAACPGEPVVLLDGDGSLLMHVQELETLMRHALPVLIVIYNDEAYGSEVHKLRADGMEVNGAVFGRTDLAAIARGFGAVGERVEDLDDLPELIDRFATEPRLTLLDIPIDDRVVSPVIRRSHGTV